MMLHPYSTARGTFVSQKRLPVLQVPTQQPSHLPTQSFTGPLQEVQSQPLQSTIALGTVLQHKAICFFVHACKGWLTKTNLKQTKKLVFKCVTLCSWWKLYWVLWKFLGFITAGAALFGPSHLNAGALSTLGHYHTKSQGNSGTKGINSIFSHSIQILTFLSLRYWSDQF